MWGFFKPTIHFSTSSYHPGEPNELLASSEFTTAPSAFEAKLKEHVFETANKMQFDKPTLTDVHLQLEWMKLKMAKWSLIGKQQGT